MLNSANVKFGIAPIGWTNDDMPELGKDITFEQCISEMALSGYNGTELGNKYPREVPVLKKALKLRNLELAGGWFSSYLTTQHFSKVEASFIDYRNFLHALGAKVIVVSEQGHSIQGKMDISLFEHKPYFTDNQWDTLAIGLNALGAIAKEKDMNLVYHHHMGTGVQTTEEINKLMEMTDPSFVSLLYDTGHLYFSGEDLIEILKKFLPRIKHVHLKDVRHSILRYVKDEYLSFLSAVKEGVFTVPGDGSIGFQPILEILSDANYEGWLIVEAEQDPSKANPFEYALMARNYLKRIAEV